MYLSSSKYCFKSLIISKSSSEEYSCLIRTFLSKPSHLLLQFSFAQHKQKGPWQLFFLNNKYNLDVGDTIFKVVEPIDTRYFASIYDGVGCVQYSDTIFVRRNPLPVAKTILPKLQVADGNTEFPGHKPAICSNDTTSLGINFLVGTPPFNVAWQSSKGQNDTVININGDTTFIIRPTNLVNLTIDAAGWGNVTSTGDISDAIFYTLPYIKDANGCVSSNNSTSDNGSILVIRAVDSVYDLIAWDSLNYCQTAVPTTGIPLNYRHNGYYFDIKINIHSEKGFVQETWYNYTYRWGGTSFKIDL